MSAQTCLSTQEIFTFIAALDKNGDGYVSKKEIEDRLDFVYRQLKPTASARDERIATEELERQDRIDLHSFIASLFPQGDEDKDAVSVSDFEKAVRSWQVPSLEQEKHQEDREEHYLDHVSWHRRWRAWWMVIGPEIVFLFSVVGLQLGLGIWQCTKYTLDDNYQAAFGWGVGLAKFSAGALYATFFFLLLSMSRWWSTAFRRFYYISRFINWDHAQSFHIALSIEAVVLATLHAIGHLTGTFVFASSPSRQDAVSRVLPDEAPAPRYADYLRTVAGASGLTALGLLYLLSLMSMPAVRRYSYELFQSVHLLMFPIIGLLMCHGAGKLLQFPILGLVIAFPTLLILIERGTRLVRSFRHMSASLKILDDDTVCLVCDIPPRRFWPYEAGQYIFLQVPQLSYFQWHPFTISTHIGREMQLHIKTDGDWTGKLRAIAEDNGGTACISIGLDGPFGAPAQRFYDYDQAIIVGAGIGITPFSAILNDLQAREDHRWQLRVRSSSWNRGSQSRRSSASASRSLTLSRIQSRMAELRGTNTPIREPAVAFTTTNHTPALPSSVHSSILPTDEHIDLNRYRRVDMHWIVRDTNYLAWFSDLLNDIVEGKGHDRDHLDIRLHNHVTQRYKDVSLHVFRYLLERFRGQTQDARSPFTGLLAPTHFGRPDFDTILAQHYVEMKALFDQHPERKRRIGVFFCGAPIIGAQLADLCGQLTIRGVQDGSRIAYHFRTEVFN